ncbi:hypothetical protein TNCV_1073121 [Trichonephila clavipes]|nr:hypothetical protein TNCV_1073121 [Trichonephila clavipes]
MVIIVAGFVSVKLQVRVLVLLKTHQAEELRHVKSVTAQSPHVVVVGKLEEWGAGLDAICVTARITITRSVANSPLIAAKSDISNQSIKVKTILFTSEFPFFRLCLR